MRGLFSRFRRSMFLGGVFGILGLIAIAFLALGVVRDLRLLSSARSDNVQWSLSQTEVEFLEFEQALLAAHGQGTPDLVVLRREFDIFFSRVNTLNNSVTYAGLREIENFSTHLADVGAYLVRTAMVMDRDDQALVSSLPDVVETTAALRPVVRALSNSGLNFFANESDKYRAGITATLIEMAVVVAVLMVALVFLTLYLARLYLESARSRNDALHANDRMNVVIGNSLDGVIVADTYGNILDFNPAAEAIFGHVAQDVIGRNLADIIIPDHFKDAHHKGMQRMRENGEKKVVGKGRVQLEANRSDGTTFPVELAIQAAETPEGPVFVAFLRDLTQQVLAEEELIQARDRAVAGEKAKTDFMATMSHEIRTPLNGLLGNLSLLEDTDTNEVQTKYITNMHTSGRLLMSHVSDVLDITKYDAGKLTLNPVDMNLSDLIQDIVDSQISAAAVNLTSLTWAWKGDPVLWIHADRARLQHILMNLVGNAVKFTSKGAIMVVAQALDEDRVKITVNDTGVGIDADFKARIFDDFVTGDTSYVRQVGGTGLGLGIAKRFVTALGGEIGVDSQEGQGSQFWITFPITRIAEPMTLTQQPDPNTKFGCHVLLVEDNEINRFVAHEMLKAAGHTVVEAENGEIGVDRTKTEAFDLILMDISMPVMDGRNATKAIRGAPGPNQTTPIVALTANAMAAEQQAFLRDGMNAILTKPLSRDALAAAIQVHVDTTLGQPSHENVPDDLRQIMDEQELSLLLKRFDQEGGDLIDWLLGDEVTDLAEVQHRTHKVAGSAAIFGPTELRQAMIDLENAAKAGDRDAVQKNIAMVEQVWRVSRPIPQAT